MTGNLKQTWQKVKDAFRGQQPQDGSWSARPDGRRLATTSDGRTVRIAGGDSGVALIIVGARSGTKVHPH